MTIPQRPATRQIGETKMNDVEFLSPADREFAALPENTRNEILAAVKALAAEGTVAELLYAPGDQVVEGAELLKLAS